MIPYFMNNGIIGMCKPRIGAGSRPKRCPGKPVGAVGQGFGTDLTQATGKPTTGEVSQDRSP